MIDLNVGLGSEEGVLQFTANLDTVNHVIAAQHSQSEVIRVQVKRLDDLLEETDCPRLIKIDVEGFETAVVIGAKKILIDENLSVVIMENGSGEIYGFDELALHKNMIDHFGFKPYTYLPLKRELLPLAACRKSPLVVFYAPKTG